MSGGVMTESPAAPIRTLTSSCARPSASTTVTSTEPSAERVGEVVDHRPPVGAASSRKQEGRDLAVRLHVSDRRCLDPHVGVRPEDGGVRAHHSRATLHHAARCRRLRYPVARRIPAHRDRGRGRPGIAGLLPRQPRSPLRRNGRAPLPAPDRRRSRRCSRPATPVPEPHPRCAPDTGVGPLPRGR